MFLHSFILIFLLIALIYFIGYWILNIFFELFFLAWSCFDCRQIFLTLLPVVLFQTPLSSIAFPPTALFWASGSAILLVISWLDYCR